MWRRLFLFCQLEGVCLCRHRCTQNRCRSADIAVPSHCIGSMLPSSSPPGPVPSSSSAAPAGPVPPFSSAAPAGPMPPFSSAVLLDPVPASSSAVLFTRSSAAFWLCCSSRSCATIQLCSSFFASWKWYMFM